MRNNTWLKIKFEEIWLKYFSDVERKNDIQISFGRRSKRRLASIKQNSRQKNSDTIITVTAYYQNERVPEEVIVATIAHEICHYAHGFGSPHPQYCRYPHQGGVVEYELKKRGLGAHLRFQKNWLRKEWNGIVGDKIFAPRQRQNRKVVISSNPIIKLIEKFGF